MKRYTLTKTEEDLIMKLVNGEFEKTYSQTSSHLLSNLAERITHHHIFQKPKKERRSKMKKTENLLNIGNYLMNLTQFVMLALILIVLLTSCLGGQTMDYAPPPLPHDFCNNEGDRSESVLVQVTADLIDNDQLDPVQTLNRGYWGFVRVSAITILIEEDTRDFLKFFMIKLKEYYNKYPGSIMARDIFDYMLNRARWGDKVDLLHTLLIPNWSAYHEPLIPLNPWDKCALETAYRHYWKVLKIEDGDAERLEKKYGKKYHAGFNEPSGNFYQHDGKILGQRYWLK